MTLRRRLIALGTVLVATAAFAAGCSDDSGDADSQVVSLDSDATDTTTEPASSSPGDTTGGVIWPLDGATAFATAEEAAVDFARNYLGMADATTAGEEPAEGGTDVEIQPYATGGPATTVHTEQRNGNHVVTGASATSIQVDPITPGNPLTVSGTSTAFEGNINLEIRDVATGNRVGGPAFTTGGSNGEFGPFSTTLPAPDEPPYVLVVYEADSSGRGAMSTATVILVT